ncbi:MAG: hypothetical protein SF187_26195 [Deltaproteobacteria bacterium]|nr:hypothetical protein [Deltaproteobacteria bacterium]
MNVQKIQIKLFTTNHSAHLEAFVPVFHEWIRTKKLPELMIDVAPYDHVPAGPGILFVGHGSDYYIDEGKGRLGLLYSRKREAPAPAERLRDSFRRAVNVAAGLQAEASLGVKFATDELLFRVNDRLGAPSTQATLDAFKSELSAFFTEALGGPVELKLVSEPRELFTVSVTLAAGAKPQALTDILARLGGPPSN